jgi:hypothetical protein
MNAAFLDHNFLTELTLHDWVSVTAELQQSLTDERIEAAFKLLPAEVYKLHAKETIAKLKKRRDNLDKYAKKYYYFLAEEVNVTGTMQKEYFEITRANNDSTKVAVYSVDKNEQPFQTIYQRMFVNEETKEIRLYGFGGDDKFNITGKTGKGILIRVIGGNGTDSVIDNSTVEGGSDKTKLYDNNESTFSSGAELKRHISQDSLKNNYTKNLFKYDWIAPKLAPGYNPDDGVYIGGGIIFKKQRFGKAPYGYMQSFWGNYAFETGAYNFWYEGIFKEAVGKWDLHLDAQINAPNYVLNYYGAGNETIKYEDIKNYYRVRAKEWIVSPSLHKQLGKYQTVGFGLNYQSVKIERSDNRYITEIVGKLDSTIFSRKHFAGAGVSYQFNTTDNELYPRKGLKLNSGLEFVQNFKESNNFARFSSDVSFFVSHRSLTAAFRIGGATNLGNDYEFYQANTLGGTTNLRGFRRSRFAGKTSLYQNTELRYKFQNINGYFLRGNWGLLAFFDNGRVWIPDESSTTWHIGYGGGIWFLPYNKIAFAASYGISKEDKLLNIKAGFFF